MTTTTGRRQTSPSHEAIGWLMDWVIPPMIVATLILLVATSNVGFDIWVIRGPIATAVVAIYITLLIAAWILKRAWLEAAAATAGVAVFGGRAAAFIETELAGNVSLNLWGNIAERVLLLTLLVTVFHGQQAWRIGWRQAGNHVDPKDPHHAPPPAVSD